MGAGDSVADEARRVAAVRATGLTNAADDALDRLASLASRLLRSPVGLVSLVDDVRQFFPGQRGLPEPLSSLRETPLAQSLCRTVVATGDVLQIDDTTVAAWAEHGATTVLGVGSYLGAPLVDADANVLGALCALGDSPRTWSDEDRETLLDLTLAASAQLQTRMAVGRANDALAEAERSNERVRLMADVSAALASTLGLERGIGRVLDAIVARHAAWAFLLTAPTADHPTTMQVRHENPAKQPIARQLERDVEQRLVEMRFTSSVLSGERDTVVLDATEAMAAASSPGETLEVFRALGIGPLIVVPLSIRGAIVGALAMCRRADAEPFAAVDITLARDLAHRVTTSILRARQYERETLRAHELQRSLLPTVEPRAEFDVDTLYIPGTQGAEVGGDWYDLIPVDRTTFVASIGDVTGHSMFAAAAMGRVQTAMRMLAIEGCDANAIVQRLGELSGVLLGDLFASCVVVRLRPAGDGAWDAEIANAGHPWPIVVEPDLTARVLVPPVGPLLGIPRSDAAPGASVTVRLAPGAMLILYTDGLIERRREPLDESMERLRAAAQVAARSGASGVFDRLLKLLDPTFADDIAGIALRVP